MERATEKYRENFTEILQDENQIIEKFISRAHHYIQSPPGNKELIEWLSIIQHYGGPTRLLDFSISFYIAAFFAIESAISNACVWAINEMSISSLSLNKFYIYPPYTSGWNFNETNQLVIRFAEAFIKNRSLDQSFVLPIVPSRLNERLAIQKRGNFFFRAIYPRALKKIFALICSLIFHLKL